MKQLLTGLLPAIIWFGISVVLFTLPGTAFPTETWLSKIYFDKIVHFIVFAIMVWLVCRAFYKSYGPGLHTTRVFLVITVAAILYGLAIEYTQKEFIPYRSFEWADVGVDALGALVGFVLSLKSFPKK